MKSSSLLWAAPALALLAVLPVMADEIAPRDGLTLRPDAGQEIGVVYQAWLSPLQQGGEEADTPALVPKAFRSTAPSVDRKDRRSRGHGTVAITRDMGRAYVHVQIAGIKPEDIVMFHIHCGRPGQLGPILVDLGHHTDLPQAFADGVLSVEITNKDIVAAAEHGRGLTKAFTAGCPIVPMIPMDRVSTIAGLAQIAAQGELYFNLHTKGQVFFGDIRGQLVKVE
ncbi:CHRD [Caulobacteraceae bacterium]